MDVQVKLTVGGFKNTAHSDYLVRISQQGQSRRGEEERSKRGDGGEEGDEGTSRGVKARGLNHRNVGPLEIETVRGAEDLQTGETTSREGGRPADERRGRRVVVGRSTRSESTARQSSRLPPPSSPNPALFVLRETCCLPPPSIMKLGLPSQNRTSFNSHL